MKPGCLKKIYLYRRLYPELLDYRLMKQGLAYFLKKATGLPVSVNIMVTYRCNFRCGICSFYGSGGIDNIEMSFKDIIKILDQLDVFKPVIFLGGGEPFVRQDIYEIINEIKKRGMKLIVSSNGFLMEPERLKGLDLDHLILSIYGPDEIHDKITNLAGSCRTVMEKMKYIAGEKIVKRLAVSTVLMPDNSDYLDEFIKGLIDLGIDYVKIENMNFITKKESQNLNVSIGGFNTRPSTLIVENDIEEQILERAWDRLERLKNKYRGKVFLKPDLDKNDFFKWYLGEDRKVSCHFVRHSLFISPRGNVIPCQFFGNSVIGTAVQDGVKYLWNSGKYRDFRRLINRNNFKVCQRCCK
ncbi:MAG: radical SAM protein [Candidatus Omnitrophica bacterium]|nr:radical SAM protein [Candidatus Omnitrophota bacterium]